MIPRILREADRVKYDDDQEYPKSEDDRAKESCINDDCDCHGTCMLNAMEHEDQVRNMRTLIGLKTVMEKVKDHIGEKEKKKAAQVVP